MPTPNTRPPSRRRPLHAPRLPRWQVYVLECADGTLYAGSTTDVDRRLREHQAGSGGAYTRARRPVRLAHQEPHPDRSAAQRREAQLKRWPRARKLAFLGSSSARKSRMLQ